MANKTNVSMNVIFVPRLQSKEEKWKAQPQKEPKHALFPIFFYYMLSENVHTT